MNGITMIGHKPPAIHSNSGLDLIFMMSERRIYGEYNVVDPIDLLSRSF